jgi:hypothetical protein
MSIDSGRDLSAARRPLVGTEWVGRQRKRQPSNPPSLLGLRGATSRRTSCYRLQRLHLAGNSLL